MNLISKVENSWNLPEFNFSFALCTLFRVRDNKGSFLIFSNFPFIIIATITKHRSAVAFFTYCKAYRDRYLLICPYFERLFKHNVTHRIFHIFILTQKGLDLRLLFISDFTLPQTREILFRESNRINTEAHK